ncbi:MAG: hypothetical protein JXB07_19780 [Anaerolineae bacterium]|nr:hypothetical protein [Anaerolineae bacterium]
MSMWLEAGYPRQAEDDREITGGSPEDDRTCPPKGSGAYRVAAPARYEGRRMGQSLDEKANGAEEASMTPNADAPSALLGCFHCSAVQVADDMLPDLGG